MSATITRAAPNHSHSLSPSLHIGVANAGLTGSLAATTLINPLTANNVGAQALSSSLDGSSPPLPPTLGVPAKPPPASLMISSAFPPIPGKLVEKMRSGQFIELKELLIDNAALLRQIQTAEPHTPMPQQPANNTRLREIQDPLSWVFCYLYYIAAATSDPLTRDMAAYGQIVIHLAQKHSGTGWQAYDRLFCLQKASNTNIPWSEISTSLMASTVISGSGQSCSLCSGSDHNSDSCALATKAQPQSVQAPPTLSLQARPPTKRPQTIDTEACRNNSGVCRRSFCKYTHKCTSCNTAGHPSYQCPTTLAKKSKPDTPVARAGSAQ